MLYISYNRESEEEKNKPRAHPGPITNEDIIDSDECYKSNESDDIYNLALKPDMRDRFDFKILGKEQWDGLFGKYGGVPLKRERYRPEFYAFNQVESTFQRLNLVILPNKDEFDMEKITKAKPLHASRRLTFKDLKLRIMKILNDPKYGYNLTETNFRLWKLDAYLNYDNVLSELKAQVDKIKSTKIENKEADVEENTGLEFPGVCLNLHGDDKTIEKLSIGQSDKIILERANEKGEFIFRYVKNMKFGKCDFCYHEAPLLVSCKCKEVHYCTKLCYEKDKRFHEDKCSAADDDTDLSGYKIGPNSNFGVTGLQNLGNTCFMNSGLQCLNNTALLAKFFLDDHYAKDINEVNPLGMKGKFAKTFAKFIKMTWCGSDSAISPSFLKKVIGKYHSAFAGYSQQDSQELITAVLDGLHEDLNRVKKKPYVESKTGTDPNDNSMSEAGWYNHLARNQSIIVDLMHGQYKSVVKCPKCNKFSVTFDPFSTISLPVPAPKERTISFYYVPYNLSKKPIKCSLSFPKKSTINQVRERIAKLLNVPKDGSTFVMLSAKTFDRFLTQDMPSKIIGKMQTSNLYVQEINPKYLNGPENIGIEAKKKAKEEEQKLKKEAEEAKKAEELKKIEESKKLAETNAAASLDSLNSTTGLNLQEEEKTKERISTGTNPWDSNNNDIHGIWNNAAAAASTTEVKENDDFNNGLSDDMLRVTLNIFTKVKYQYYTTCTKDRKTFNRLIYIKRSHTMKDLHHAIFSYLRPLFELSLATTKTNIVPAAAGEPMQTENNSAAAGSGSTLDGLEKQSALSTTVKSHINEELLKKYQAMPDSEFFEMIFPGLEETNWEEKTKSGGNYPYELRFVNVAERLMYNKEKCYFCGNADCENCLVPYNDANKVSDMLTKMGKPNLKNDYYYYEHRYYNADRKEFELEVVFNEDKSKWIADPDYLEEIDVHKDYGDPNANRETSVSIYSCFDQFSNWETLDENNLWYCSVCKDSVQASKRMELLRCPAILVLHLKRFKIKEVSVMGTTGGRLNTLVDYPLTGLDLTPYIQKSDRPAIYDLYAVSNHYGSTGFGHYTAFAQNKGVWYKFDDSSVSKIDASQVCSTAGYVLFYKRRDIGEEIDYNRIKQIIPDWYKVPEIVTKPKEVKKEENKPTEVKKEEPQNNIQMNDISIQPVSKNNQDGEIVKTYHENTR